MESLQSCFGKLLFYTFQVLTFEQNFITVVYLPRKLSITRLSPVYNSSLGTRFVQDRDPASTSGLSTGWRRHGGRCCQGCWQPWRWHDVHWGSWCLHNCDCCGCRCGCWSWSCCRAFRSCCCCWGGSLRWRPQDGGFVLFVFERLIDVERREVGHEVEGWRLRRAGWSGRPAFFGPLNISTCNNICFTWRKVRFCCCRRRSCCYCCCCRSGRADDFLFKRWSGFGRSSIFPRPNRTRGCFGWRRVRRRWRLFRRSSDWKVNVAVSLRYFRRFCRRHRCGSLFIHRRCGAVL